MPFSDNRLTEDVSVNYGLHSAVQVFDAGRSCTSIVSGHLCTELPDHLLPRPMSLTSPGTCSSLPQAHSGTRLMPLDAAGIAIIHQNSWPGGGIWTSSPVIHTFSISTNTILTLFNTKRLILYGTKIQRCMGVPARANWLHKTALTMDRCVICPFHH